MFRLYSIAYALITIIFASTIVWFYRKMILLTLTYAIRHFYHKRNTQLVAIEDSLVSMVTIAREFLNASKANLDWISFNSDECPSDV